MTECTTVGCWVWCSLMARVATNKALTVAQSSWALTSQRSWRRSIANG